MGPTLLATRARPGFRALALATHSQRPASAASETVDVCPCTVAGRFELAFVLGETGGCPGRTRELDQRGGDGVSPGRGKVGVKCLKAVHQGAIRSRAVGSGRVALGNDTGPEAIPQRLVSKT
jgi:hypothetical protein